VRQIAAGKPFLLQCVFGCRKFVELTQLWCSAEAFADLPRSTSDAGRYFGAREGHATERAFWQQFQAPSHPELLNHQMKHLMELFRMAKPALVDLCIHLWPSEPLPTSFFGLVARLREAGPQVTRWKRSTCLEGVQRAYACMKMHYPRLDASLVALGPPEGKDRTAEQFLARVLEGARITEAQCPKNTLYF
jgi:hypothetical protein